MALDFESALFTKLSTDIGISGIVGTRVYPFTLPPTATLPAVTYQLITDTNAATHDEAPGSSLVEHSVQILAYAVTYAGAVALAAAIYTAIHGYKGIVTKGVDTFTIQACLRTNKRDDHDSETGIFWRSQDFAAWAQE